METLRPQTPEVPDHVRVLHVGLRITLLGMDEGRKLQAAQRLRSGKDVGNLRKPSVRSRQWIQKQICLARPPHPPHQLTSRASLMKKMGALLPVRSQLPSSV